MTVSVKLPSGYPEELKSFFDWLVEAGIVPNREHVISYQRSKSYSSFIRSELTADKEFSHIIEIGGGNFNFGYQHYSQLPYQHWSFIETRPPQYALAKSVFKSSQNSDTKVSLIDHLEAVKCHDDSVVLVHLDYVNQLSQTQKNKLTQWLSSINCFGETLPLVFVGFDIKRSATQGYLSQTYQGDGIALLEWIKINTNHMHMGFRKVNIDNQLQAFILELSR